MTKTSEETLQLNKRIKELEEEVLWKDKLIFSLEDSIPKAQSNRKRYVGDIALFYQSIFKEKLKHFIGDQLEELAQIGRTELSSNIIRSNINCFRLIGDWMELKTNEHIGNVEEMRGHSDTDKDFINNMKTTYGEN